MTALRRTVPIALIAALAVQIGHEAVHAVTAWLVGARVTWFHLFAVDSEGASAIGGVVVAASAALVNILVALGCMAAFHRDGLKRRPSARLLVFCLAAFNLFTGFGYLMTNALFYSAEAAGDWNRVITHLGGGWGVRLPILLVGVAGTAYGFFWVPRAAQQFVADPVDRSQRIAVGRAVLLVPYLAISALMTALAVGHPLGSANGVVIVGLHYWFGYFALGWGFPMSAFWLTGNLPSRDDTTPLPAGWSPGWNTVAALLLLASLALLRPGS